MNILRPGHQLKVVFYDSKVVTVKYDVLLKVRGKSPNSFYSNLQSQRDGSRAGGVRGAQGGGRMTNSLSAQVALV